KWNCPISRNGILWNSTRNTENILVDIVRKNNQRQFSENSKIRLKNAIGKRITTAIIAAIESVELHFGELWGHGQTELSPAQLAEREKWMETRKRILDKGNHQRRLIADDLAEFKVEWNKGEVTLPIIEESK